MCVCVYIYAYIYICVCMHACMHTYMYVAVGSLVVVAHHLAVLLVYHPDYLAIVYNTCCVMCEVAPPLPKPLTKP